MAVSHIQSYLLDNISSNPLFRKKAVRHFRPELQRPSDRPPLPEPQIDLTRMNWGQGSEIAEVFLCMD